MLFCKRPLVPVAISFICGIAFAKFFCIPPLVFFIALIVCIIGKRNECFFYISIFFIGYAFYRFMPYYNPDTGFGSVREYIRGIIYYNMPCGDERNLLSGLFLGERQRLSKEITDVLRNTNTIHILAISGDHIGFIALMFVGILRLALIPRKIASFIALACVIIYVSMIGWQAPTFRAVVMFGVFAAGWIIDRPTDIINTLALAAIVILIVTPSALFDAGFQLSFVIVLSLLIAVPNIRGNYLKKTLCGSAVAWVGCMPLAAYYFNVISPVSILANLVTVGAVSIILAVGFTSILFGSIYIGISGVFNTVNYFIAKNLLAFLNRVSDIPYGYFYIEKIPVYIVFLSYAVIGIVFFSLSKKTDSVVE